MNKKQRNYYNDFCNFMVIIIILFILCCLIFGKLPILNH